MPFESVTITEHLHLAYLNRFTVVQSSEALSPESLQTIFLLRVEAGTDESNNMLLMQLPR